MQQKEVSTNSNFKNSIRMDVNLGVVLRGDFDILKEIARLLEAYSGVTIVYSTISANQLWIKKEEKEKDG